MTKPSIFRYEGHNYLVPFLIISSLFFMWGFAHGILEVLNPHFQESFHISKAMSALTQAAVYGAYFLMAFCGYKVVDEHGKSQSRPVYNRSGLISREEAFCLDADSLCMLMVKTDIMKDTLLPDLRNGEDVATVPLLMAKANRYAATT